MKHIPTILTLLLVLIAIASAVRLAVVCSRTEVGWEVLAAQWSDATLGWFSERPEAIQDRHPVEQAEFWLAETERIVAAHPDDPEILMGAAWVLDSPGVGFYRKFLSDRERLPGMPQFGPDIDYDAIEEAEEDFEELCLGQCLALAAKATEKDPTEVRWWRMRAMAQFIGMSLVPHEESIFEVLETCRRHDPDNALYDYLTALILWNESSEYEWRFDDGDTDEAFELTIHDEAAFLKGVEHFERAQTMLTFEIGEAGLSAVAQFLELSETDLLEQAEVATSRRFTLRHSMLFAELWRWQSARCDRAKQTGALGDQVEILKQQLRLHDQAIEPEDTTALSTLMVYLRLRHRAFEELWVRALIFPGIIDGDEIERLNQREETLAAEDAITQRGVKQVVPTLNTAGANWTSAQTWTVAVLAAALSTIPFALLLVFVFWIIGLLLDRTACENARLGWLRQSICWCTAYALSFIILGVVPAQRFDVAGIAMAPLLIGCLVLLVVFLRRFIRALRRGEFRFSVRELFWFVCGFAALGAAWPAVQFAVGALKTFNASRWIQPRGWEGLDAEVIQLALSSPDQSWLWAFIQWAVHFGPIFGIAASLLLSLLWFAWRRTEVDGRRFSRFFSRGSRQHWAAALRLLGASALVACLCWAIVYLALAPEAIRLAEEHFQQKMSYVRDPESHWRRIDSARKEIREAYARVLE